MITKKTYVKRLEKMLDHPDPCATCPAIVRFVPYNNAEAQRLSAWTDKEKGILYEEICEMCRDFVNATSCPCCDLGAKKAINRAREAIKKFWEEEEKKKC